MMDKYPIPPNCIPDERPEHQKERLLQVYREFAVELHAGMQLKQLVSNREYSSVHCQLMEDLVTLKLDQNNGCIIEFPLTNVSRVYRVVKCGRDTWNPISLYQEEASSSGDGAVVEFSRRKLTLIFEETEDSRRFVTCMGLLVRAVQERQQQLQAVKTVSHSLSGDLTDIVAATAAITTPCLRKSRVALEGGV